MPFWSPCLGMGYVEARHYMESWPKSILAVSDCIIEMDILSVLSGRDWGQEEKGRTEDEMAGWHH